MSTISALVLYGNESANDLFTARVERDCKILEDVFRARYDFYSEDNLKVQFVKSRPIVKANKDVNVRIAKGWPEINAVSMPNGTIILSDRLLSFCDYTEELDFVLQHEIRHYKSGHSKEIIESKNPFGGMRRAEYEADLEDMLAETNKFVNPAGGTVFLEKLGAKEKGKQGIVHGSTYTRLIGVEYVIRLVDLDALTSELTKMPEYTRTAAKAVDRWKPEKTDEELIDSINNNELLWVMENQNLFWQYDEEHSSMKECEIKRALKNRLREELRKAAANTPMTVDDIVDTACLPEKFIRSSLYKPASFGFERMNRKELQERKLVGEFYIKKKEIEEEEQRTYTGSF